ncbi:nezukol synthase KSL3-like [Andrographis paniculata]|uniref:Kaurene synthase-like 1 n=1 Tax=Andrographis paniculata TaxID=175694 RepID=A0A3G1S3T8_ANDPA|nr:nezukol synthase KSL3-like [Andrographis paniculata]AXL95253.1 kaurene synthase-like 1 [Andrographis paniculata]
MLLRSFHFRSQNVVCGSGKNLSADDATQQFPACRRSLLPISTGKEIEASIEKIRQRLFGGKMENTDGSWGWGNYSSPTLVKDSLSCTLACLLALRKWNVAPQLVHKGLNFIGSNGRAISCNESYSPIGFDIVFPHMISCGYDMGLNLPFDPILVDSLLRKRDTLLKRNGNSGYIAEGLGVSCNWKKILTQQSKNGSLFNSPATTAAALIHTHDDKCFQYLLDVLGVFERWVPSAYPSDIYSKLCIVDTLERLGIAKHFLGDIDNIIDETYRLWLQKEEEIFADIRCLSLAFRHLRMKGFAVSSDKLAEFVDQDHFLGSVNLEFTGVDTILELYRASHLRMSEGEVALEKIHSWTGTFLKQQLLDQAIFDKRLQRQVETELRFDGMSNLFENIRSIKEYDVEHFQMRKTAHRCPTLYNEDILAFLQTKLSSFQAKCNEEMRLLTRWYEDSKLSSMKCECDAVMWSYVVALLVFNDPHHSEARIWYTKTSVIATLLDDYYDLYSTIDEAQNFTELLRSWNKKKAINCSQDEKVLLAATYNTVNELAENARTKQDQCFKDDIISMWIEIVSCYMKEKQTSSSNKKPTLDQYLSCSWITMGCKLGYTMTAHFLGVKVTEDILTNSKCANMLKHISLIGRLLNDLRGFEREEEEGKVNSLHLLLNDGFSLEEAAAKAKQMIEYSRRNVMQVCNNLHSKQSLVPKECVEMIWGTYEAVWYVYCEADRIKCQKQAIEDLNSLIQAL